MNSITCNRMVLCLTLINTTTNEHPQSATKPKQSFFGSKDAIQDGCYNHPFSTNKLTHQKQLHKNFIYVSLALPALPPALLLHFAHVSQTSDWLLVRGKHGHNSPPQSIPDGLSCSVATLIVATNVSGHINFIGNLTDRCYYTK